MTRTLSAMVALLAAGVLFLTGCAEQSGGSQVASAEGNDSSSASASASPSPSLDREEQALKFVECMRKNGVDMPDPGPNGNIQMRVNKDNQAKMEKAQEACREYAPSKLSGQQANPEQVERIREFTTCMRDHGIKMEDPDPNNPGMIKLDGKGQDPDKLQAAQEACGDIMQGLGQGSGGN